MKDCLNNQFQQLTSKYKNLVLEEAVDGCYKISGWIGFTSSAKGHTLQDRYNMEIVIPAAYPDNIPWATEIGERIPEDFHRHPDKSLCLAAPLELKRKFNQTKTLIGFVEDLVIPFLFQYSFYEKYGKLPFGDLSHGLTGIIEYYKELFNTEDSITALSLLKILAENNYRGHHKCPCGSNIILRKCHGPILLELKSLKPHSYYVVNYAQCALNLSGESRIPEKLRSNKVSKLLQKM